MAERLLLTMALSLVKPLRSINQQDGRQFSPFREETARLSLQDFHEQLIAEYGAVLSSDRDLLYKMKELWFYLLDSFEDSEKARKQIRKCEKLSEYHCIVRELFEGHPLV